MDDVRCSVPHKRYGTGIPESSAVERPAEVTEKSSDLASSTSLNLLPPNLPKPEGEEIASPSGMGLTGGVDNGWAPEPRAVELPTEVTEKSKDLESEIADPSGIGCTGGAGNDEVASNVELRIADDLPVLVKLV